MSREDVIVLLESKKNPKNGMLYMKYDGAKIFDYPDSCEMALVVFGKEIKRLGYVVKGEDNE